jgi:hypothetical protein
VTSPHDHDAGAPGASGRSLPPGSAFAGDDGSVPTALAAALARTDDDARLAAVVDALREVRVLVPVVARLDERAEPVAPGAPAGEKSAHAAMVTVAVPDGRAALPVFSGTTALRAWRPDARPVPTDARRAALAAGAEADGLLVLDAGGPVTVTVPRPAVRAIALGESWVPGWRDPQVRAAVRDALAGLAGVRGTRVERGSTTEVVVVIGHDRQPGSADLRALLAAVGDRLAGSQVVADRVDSLTLRPALLR